MNTSLHVLHIVDSLYLGGAERVAVNLVNALAEKGVDVHLCVTRKEGPLKQFLDERVHYLFLEKKGKADFECVRRLRNYIQKNHINVVHAHSSSFFIAVLATVKCLCKIVWHDHYGNAEALSERKSLILRLFSKRFSFVYSVNNKLKQWATDYLKIDKRMIEFLPNYPDLNIEQRFTQLPGKKTFKIICLANLRPQKDHLTLLCALKKNMDLVELYLVGSDSKNKYSQEIMQYIEQNGLNEVVHILGGRSDIYSILKQCHIGILSSKSEGLPVSLLEYGLAGLPVICTSVGECPEVLGHGKYGLLVEPGDVEGLSNAMKRLIEDEEFRNELALKYQRHVLSNYSKEAIVESIMAVYEELIDE